MLLIDVTVLSVGEFKLSGISTVISKLYWLMQVFMFISS